MTWEKKNSYFVHLGDSHYVIRPEGWLNNGEGMSLDKRQKRQIWWNRMIKMVVPVALGAFTKEKEQNPTRVMIIRSSLDLIVYT